MHASGAGERWGGRGRFRLPNAAECWIQRAIARVWFVIRRVRPGRRRLRLASLQSGRSRSTEIGERSNADCAQQRSAVRGSLLSIHRHHRHAVHLGLETPDEWTLRPPAGEQELVGRQPELLKNAERITEGKTYSLEHRTREMRARMRQAQTIERATRRRIAIRRTLALQIRK